MASLVGVRCKSLRNSGLIGLLDWSQMEKGETEEGEKEEGKTEKGKTKKATRPLD